MACEGSMNPVYETDRNNDYVKAILWQIQPQ